MNNLYKFILVSSLLLFTVKCGFKINGNDEYDLVGGNFAISGDKQTVTLNGNNRVSFAKGGQYSSFNLLGSTISFDVDNLGAAGCGCNIAFYGVQLSAVGFGDYCDANGVGGKWCPEMDFFEGNAHALHTTPHCCCSGDCNGTNGDQCLGGKQSGYNKCDAWGQAGGYGGTNAPGVHFSQSYGPGKYIDTNQKFNYRLDVQKSGMMAVTLTQGGKTNSMSFSNGNYLGKFAAPMTDMGLIFSSWSASNMLWLDGGEGGCSGYESCDLGNMNVRISNMKVTGGSGPPPPPPSHKYVYGDKCAHNTDGQCGSSCNNCRWSWPEGQSSSSSDADCRCAPGGSGGSYEYGSKCAHNNDDLCGNSCNDCCWSWPTGQSSSSSDAHCRCKSSSQFLTK